VNLLFRGFPVLSFAFREAMIECWIHGEYGEFSQAPTGVMLRRSKISIVIGSQFATSSGGAKYNWDRLAKRLCAQLFDGRDGVRYAAPTELAALLVWRATKIYLLRRIQRCASALLGVSSAFEIKLKNEPRAERQAPNAEPRTPNAKRRTPSAKRRTLNGHAWSLKDQ